MIGGPHDGSGTAAEAFWNPTMVVLLQESWGGRASIWRACRGLSIAPLAPAPTPPPLPAPALEPLPPRSARRACRADLLQPRHILEGRGDEHALLEDGEGERGGPPRGAREPHRRGKEQHGEDR